MVKQFKKDVKEIVAASAILGAGGAVIGATGQGAIIGPTIGRAARFTGPVIAGVGASAVLRQLERNTRRMRER